MTLIDSEELDLTNGNRYIGAYYYDAIPGSRKVILGARMARSIDPSIDVTTIDDSFVSEAGFAALRTSDLIFGCVDREGARLLLTEFSSAYAKPYIDLATDVTSDQPPEYGGRVMVSIAGDGCLVCYDQLDIEEAQKELSGPEGAKQRAAIYGVDKILLGGTGPSVVSINGLIASLGVTELMVLVTGLREPAPLQTYRGRAKRFSVPAPLEYPKPDCYYCKGLYGSADKADVERYVRAGYGRFMR
jgi:hypothetical protein